MSAMTSTLDEKLSRCIRCGFCLDACPTFRLTGREPMSPRGRIYLVRSWRDGVIPFDSGVVDALDTCLGCRACETACPSGVEYGSILEAARTYIENAHLRPKLESAARHQLLAALTNPGRLVVALRAAGLLGKLTGGQMPGLAARLLSGSADISLPLPKADGVPHASTLPERLPAHGERRYRVGMLAGCVMRVLYGKTNEATVEVLRANGCEVVTPASAGCCGALHLHTGFHSDGLERARAFIDAFTPIVDELDAIVINSAGCGSTIKEYGALLAGDPAYAAKSAALAAKARDVSEWLMEIGWTAAMSPVNEVVTYHDACHLAHGQRVRLQPRALLEQIPGIRLVELEESDTCCGSAGIYNLTEPAMARQLLERKVQFIRATGASVIATGNPGCLAWIAQGLQEAGLSVEILHPMELLARALIEKPA